MKILYVGSYYKPAYNYGGPVSAISGMCEGMVRAGCEVTVFATNANGRYRLNVPMNQAIELDGVRVWYFPLVFGGLSFFYSPELGAALRKHIGEYDIVETPSIWGHSLWELQSASIRSNVPFVVTPHGQLYPWALAQKGVKKQLYLKMGGMKCLTGASALRCTDTKEAEAVAELNLRPPTFVVPNGIDLSSFVTLPERGALRRKLKIAEDAFILLFLGRLHRNKGPEVAVESLIATSKIRRNVHLILAGYDEEGLARKLSRVAHHNNCGAQFHYCGLFTPDEVVQALVDSDLLLVPSQVHENFGMTAAEAMAAGVPILSTEGVPVGRWAQEIKAGRLASFKPGAFAQAAAEILGSSVDLKSMGERGRVHAFKSFSVDTCARNLIDQFEAILATGRPLYTAS